MKFLIILLSCSLSLSLYAQERKFTLSTGITSWDTISDGTAFLQPGWQGFQGERIPLGFSFPFLDSTFHSVRYEVTGRLVFDDGHHYYADPFVMANLEDGAISGQAPSQVVYVQSDTVGIKSVTIQVLNARFTKNQSRSVSFQIKLQEKGSITYTMGPHDSIQQATDIALGPYVGVYHAADFSPATFSYGQNWLELTPEADTLFSGAISNFLDFKCQSFPNEGTFIELSPSIPLSIQPGLPSQSDCPKNIQEVCQMISHNPTLTYQVYQLDGKIISTPGNLNQLAAGTYIIQLSNSCSLKVHQP